jgi:hypothetical protein
VPPRAGVVDRLRELIDGVASVEDEPPDVAVAVDPDGDLVVELGELIGQRARLGCIVRASGSLCVGSLLRLGEVVPRYGGRQPIISPPWISSRSTSSTELASTTRPAKP